MKLVFSMWSSYLVLCLYVCLEFEAFLCTRKDSEDFKKFMVSAAMLTIEFLQERGVVFNTCCYSSF